MDYAALRETYPQIVPFIGHLDLEIVELAPEHAVVRLPDDPRLRNHVASQHAGALFTAGETASGGALLAAFAERLGEMTPLAESAEIAYRKVARGPITATGRLGAERDAVLGEVEEQGRARFPIEVELTDEAGDVVAEMTVRWYMRRNDA